MTTKVTVAVRRMSNTAMTAIATSGILQGVILLLLAAALCLAATVGLMIYQNDRQDNRRLRSLSDTAMIAIATSSILLGINDY